MRRRGPLRRCEVRLQHGRHAMRDDLHEHPGGRRQLRALRHRMPRRNDVPRRSLRRGLRNGRPHGVPAHGSDGPDGPDGADALGVRRPQHQRHQLRRMRGCLRPWGDVRGGAVHVLRGLYAMRRRRVPRSRRLRRPDLEQRRLRGLRPYVPEGDAALLGEHLRRPVPLGGVSMRSQLRRYGDGQGELRPLRHHVREQSDVQRRDVRVQSAVHELQRELRRHDDEQRRLRHVRRDLHGAVDVPERQVPVTRATA
jgi:hypothetical protein